MRLWYSGCTEFKAPGGSRLFKFVDFRMLGVGGLGFGNDASTLGIQLENRRGRLRAQVHCRKGPPQPKNHQSWHQSAPEAQQVQLPGWLDASRRASCVHSETASPETLRGGPQVP